MKTLIASAFISCLLGTAYAQTPNYSFQNTQLPLEQRVTDLVNRLTLEEKVAQMMYTAPAIPRLGMPAYNWWNEALHVNTKEDNPISRSHK